MKLKIRKKGNFVYGKLNFWERIKRIWKNGF